MMRLYETKGIAQITVKEICQLAGYNRATFYNHFTDVPAMLSQVEDETLLRIGGIVRRLSTKELFQSAAIFEIMKGAYQENQQLLTVLLTKPDSHFPQKVKALMRTVVLGHFPGLPANEQEKMEIAISYHFSAVIGVISAWLQNGQTPGIDHVIDYVREISQQGIFTVIGKLG